MPAKFDPAADGAAARAGTQDSDERSPDTIPAPQKPAPRLIREPFSVSRLGEFCSQKELVAATGHVPDEWPLCIAKELIDNGIDVAEEHGVAPVISIEVSAERGEIIVTDNGPGIPPETVDNIIDYRVKTSSRAGYVSPTRGQQGNALQTIVAMPFAFDPEIGETVIIEAHGVAHRIRFTIDPIRQEPRISCNRGTSTVRNGTRLTVRWPAKASHLLEGAADRFLPLVWDYVGLNPHLAITLDLNGERLVNVAEAIDPGWEKWRPSDPIPAHWYNADLLQRYMAACVHRDIENGSRVRSVRDFVGTFRGLSGTAKRAAVLKETELFRASLDVFFRGDQVDHVGITRLLGAMQRNTRPAKPEALGLIGEEHFRSVFETDDADQSRFKYTRTLGEDLGLPFVVEVAFAPAAERSPTPLISGLNWSPAIKNPFRSLGRYRQPLESVLFDRHVHLVSDAALIGVHLASPVVQFTDRGKSAAVLGTASGDAIVAAVEKVTKQWAADWEAKQREMYRSRREIDREMEALLKAERAAERGQREKDEIVGTGVLYQEIAEAAAASGLPIKALTVLSLNSDPYVRDTRYGHRDGQWFADQVARFIALDKKIHLRELFYLIVSASDVRCPDGSPFVNDLDCWLWLQGHASYAARWLGLVPFERIRDERNGAPLLISYATPPSEGSGDLTANYFGLDLPQVSTLMPHLSGTAPSVSQPYRIILIGEKSSLAEVLEPIAREVAGELLLPTGEPSITMIAEMAARAAADPRPAVVLYFSDFDPAGHQMPISVARKLQALRTLRHPELKIEVHRVALTIDQVRRLGLPSTPLKATERRADKWRARHGHEQTEIDALAALRPYELREIARQAVAPFYDFTLDQRCRAAYQEWEGEAEKQLKKHRARAAAEKKISDAFKGVKKARSALIRAQGAALKALNGAIPKAEFTTPEIEIKAAAAPPLFSASDSFIDATRKLITSKALDDEEDAP